MNVLGLMLMNNVLPTILNLSMLGMIGTHRY